jgi:hypothetical protein
MANEKTKKKPENQHPPQQPPKADDVPAAPDPRQSIESRPLLESGEREDRRKGKKL